MGSASPDGPKKRYRICSELSERQEQPVSASKSRLTKEGKKRTRKGEEGEREEREEEQEEEEEEKSARGPREQDQPKNPNREKLGTSPTKLKKQPELTRISQTYV